MAQGLGVYPVFDIEFKISPKGKVDHKELTGMIKIAEMETFEPTVDGVVEEWTPMDTRGWVRRLSTGKGFTISLSGRRNEGDPGNDYVFGLSLKTGRACSTTAVMEFPDGAQMVFDCVVNVTTPFGGDSTNVSKLDFELMSDGEPTYVEAPAG